MAEYPRIPFGDYLCRPAGDVHSRSLKCTTPECVKAYQTVELQLGVCPDGIRIKCLCPLCGKRFVFLELEGDQCPAVLTFRPDASAKSETRAEQVF